MPDPLIKSVNLTPRIQDTLKKQDSDKKRKPRSETKQNRKKDHKRIIDTYA